MKIANSVLEGRLLMPWHHKFFILRLSALSARNIFAFWGFLNYFVLLSVCWIFLKEKLALEKLKKQ
jgi:hypothetical protein